MKIHFMAAAFFVAFIFVFSGCKKNTSENNVVSKVTYFEGEVTVNMDKAKVGQNIKTGDIIKTGANSSCEIVIDNKNIIRIVPDSSMIFKVDKENGIFVLEKGFLAGVIKNRENVKTFEVETRTVSAGIRGTTFFMGAESDYKSYVCICNGTLHLLPLNASDEPVSAVHHKGYYFSVKDNKAVEDTAGMLYHDDAMMNDLASKIGVTIDWNAVEKE